MNFFRDITHGNSLNSGHGTGLARRIALAATLMSLLLTSACANFKPTQSGFLTQYDQVCQNPKTPGDPCYVKPGMAAAAYTAFMLDPVVFQPVGKVPGILDQKKIDELRADYREKLTDAFSKRYQLTDRPGPGVLRVRAAITNVGRSIPLLNILIMAAVVVPVTSGGASTEAEVVDSVTGERLVALLASNNGGRSFLGGPFGFLTQYGHAERAFTIQAKALRDLLPDSSGTKP